MSASTIPAIRTRSPLPSPQSMFARDSASRGLGMQIVRVAPGEAELSMTVRPDMLNGHAICHGGFIFTLADSAFAFACNSANLTTVANGCSIEFLAPAQLGDVLTATARERAQVGRNGIYDVEVRNQRGHGHRPFPRQEHAHQGHGAGGPRIMTARIPRPDELEPIERASATSSPHCSSPG